MHQSARAEASTAFARGSSTLDRVFEMERAARVEGGLVGLLVGDALGVPYEFHPPEAIPGEDAIETSPPQGFLRSHSRVLPATYSDDGAHALCLLASLLDRGGLDVGDFAHRLRAWYDDGYLAVDGLVFDFGVQTSRAIAALAAGVTPEHAGPSDERSNGNGSLMRVLPLALLHRGSDAALVADAHHQSRVTHGHLRSQVCCALYVLWARRVLDGYDDARGWDEAVAALRTIYRDNAAARMELEERIRPDDEATVEGTGYVVDALRSARWACTQGDYERVVRVAIRLGHDTDTTAAIAGGIAGVRDGVDAIPSRWRAALRGEELWRPLVEQACAR
jgi:ADP-ribosyl-[dinitrogen reductase] hydrolase